MDLQLKDRVAFVAGSSRGIGKAIAAALLAEGARVILTGRDETSLQKTSDELAAVASPKNILTIPGDFTDADTIAVAFDRTFKHFGQFDILVANLGTGSGKTGWQTDEAEWQRLFNLNLFGSARLAQAAIPYLERSDAASILFISSIVAVEATPAPLPYSAAKAALLNYSKNLARQLALQKIRVNSIAPGNIFFPGGSWERHLTSRREQVEQMLKTEVPQDRFGTPEEIADLAVFLCSPRSAFTTGACFVADGGQTRSL